jgi:DNA-binding transcriptional ArsR family regulator
MQKSQLIDVSIKKILAHIKEHTGIRYRQLVRLTGLSHRKMSFHLGELKKSKLVKAKKLRYNMTRYYPIAVDSSESDILDYIQDSTRRKIILLLLEHSDCRFREIVHYIDKAQSTTSSHLRRLERAGIISVLRIDRKNQFYRLKNKSRIIKIVSKYKMAAQ